MAELTPQDRLQPALLDRLTDDDPGNPQEPRERRVMSKSRLRQAILRDLAFLLNATRLEADTELTPWPDVRRSVVNYGLPALSGRTASSLSLTELERTIRQTILEFEPRILAATLQVTALADEGEVEHNILGIEIRGQLWAQPVPLEMLVRTQIDLETGAVEMSDLLGSTGS